MARLSAHAHRGRLHRVIGLNWRRGTGAGALAAMLAGTAVVVAWSLPEAAPLGLDPIFAGVGTSILAFVAVSYAPVGAGFSRPDTRGLP